MRKIILTCTNEGFCSKFNVEHELDAYAGYVAQSYICTECQSHMDMKFVDDKVASDG